jgi:uncharacterized YigZ family protein
MPAAYLQPAQPVEVTHKAKKSTFIARVGRAENRTAAMQMLTQTKTDYPDARHYCWAFLLGDPHQPTGMASSDDGEPQGTAGKPMLNVLSHKAVGDVMVVIIRYFGGVKLGAGGLVRAYSTATQMAMDALTLVQKMPVVRRRIRAAFADEHSIRHQLDLFHGQIVEARYGEHLDLLIEIPAASETTLQDSLAGHRGIIILPE